MVRVLFFGILKDIVGRSEENIEVSANTTLASLFERYSSSYETLRDKRSSILFARNREFSTPDTILSDNDEVAFLPPVSGGSGSGILVEAGHEFGITRHRIDTQQLVRRLQRP